MGMLWAVSLFLLFTVTASDALERCNQYVQPVRRFHSQYFGLDFPSGYSVAQLQAESNCRHNILSGDGVGSEGLSQITYAMWKVPLSREGIPEIKTVGNHLRAHAFINRLAYDQAKVKRLWVMYQIYNGGGLVNKEIARARSSCWRDAYSVCKRRDVHFSNGQVVNACDINYRYSQEIYRLGSTYYGAVIREEYLFW